jgi:hypothetical protein
MSAMNARNRHRVTATNRQAEAFLVWRGAGERRGSARGVRGFDPAAGHPFRVESARFPRKGITVPTWLWIVLIVILIAILAYRYRGRISRR